VRRISGRGGVPCARHALPDLLIEVFHFPDFIGQLSPSLCIGIHFIFFNRVNFFGTRMGESRINLPDDRAHNMGIVDDHAGAQMVLIVGLDGANMAKEAAV
jgi:hypothetical protein